MTSSRGHSTARRHLGHRPVPDGRGGPERVARPGLRELQGPAEPDHHGPAERAEGGAGPGPRTGFFEFDAPDQSGRWKFYSAQLATASGHGDPQAVVRLATTAKRMARLLEPGTWTTDTCRVIHLDRDNGLWATAIPVDGPRLRHRRYPPRRRAHRAEPDAEGLCIAQQPDGRIRVNPAPTADQPAAGPDAERSRLEKLRGQYRQALDRSCVVQEVDRLAYVLAPELRPQPRTA